MRLNLHVDINGVNKATLSVFKTLAPKSGLIHTICMVLDNGMKTHIDFISGLNREDILCFCAGLIKIQFVQGRQGETNVEVECLL